MDRDALLVAALGVAVLAGCTPDPSPHPAPAPSGSTTPPVDPDVRTLAGWALAERDLAARYAPLARRVPALAALRTNHLARAAACDDLLAARGAPLPRSIAKPSNGTPRALAAAFAGIERRLAARYLRDLARVADPDVAVLGAELAAGARQHAVALGLVPVPA